MEPLDFLAGETPDDANTPAAEVDAGPARGPDGKFISQADPPEPQPEPAPIEVEAAQPPPVQQPEPGHVPLSAVLDEREKRQALERELAELRRQHAQAPAPQVDPYEDPVAHVEQRVLNTKLDMSEEMARSKHGDDLVNQARDWAMAKMGQSPAFQQEVLSNRHPYEYAVQAYQRDQMVSQLTPADLAAFKAWQAAQASLQTAPAAVAAAPPQPVAAPPRSLASATSAGGMQAVPTGDGQAFDALFKR